MAVFIAQQLSDEFIQDNPLYNEIQATCHRFSDQVFGMLDSTETIISCYRKGQKQKTHVLQLAQQAVDELTENNHHLLSVLNEKQEELQRLSVKYDDVEAARDQLTQQQSETNDRVKVAEQENELLLLQLHQVQEELGAHFLKHQEIEAKQRVLQSELSLACGERDQQTHQLSNTFAKHIR